MCVLDQDSARYATAETSRGQLLTCCLLQQDMRSDAYNMLTLKRKIGPEILPEYISPDGMHARSPMLPFTFLIHPHL